MRSLENTLALWMSGILTSAEVNAWAEREIARQDQPSIELIDLFLDGPETCLKRPQADFPPSPSCLPYLEAFSVRASLLDLAAGTSVERFASWAARACMGEDLSHPFVKLGYLLDHLINDCQEPGRATRLVRAELPGLLPLCVPIAEPYLEASDPSLERTRSGKVSQS